MTTQDTETKLISVLQKVYGTAFVKDSDKERILTDIGNVLVARKTFGIIGEHYFCCLNRALNNCK